MNDSLGNELQINDRIVFVNCTRKNEFRNIETGTIVKICNCFAKIKRDKPSKYWSPEWYRFPADICYRKPDRIIKI